MPVSQSYFLETLLARSSELDPSIDWREATPGGFVAEIAGVRLILRMVSETAGSRVALFMEDRHDEICIAEPRPNGIFRRTFTTEDDRRLSELFRSLFSAVTRRIARRKMAAWEDSAAVEQRLFSRVLFFDDHRAEEPVEVSSSKQL